MTQLNEQDKSYLNGMKAAVAQTNQFLKEADKHAKSNQGIQQCFDSINQDQSKVAYAMPLSLRQLTQSKLFAKNQYGDHKHHIFDGLEIGLQLYKKRHGGEMPSMQNMAAIFDSVVQGFTEHSTDPIVKKMFDSLNYEHHEALSVVREQVKVTLINMISHNLPLVALLPNAMGSNEVPLLYARNTANMTHAAMKKGEYLDGERSGLPYFHNYHTVTMEKADNVFSLDIHQAYREEKQSNGTLIFKMDKTSPKVPFLGGRVSIYVKGVEVANDNHLNHPTSNGISSLSQLEQNSPYKITSAQADLDNHRVTVTFDNSGTVPAENEVEVMYHLDYERKDSKGERLISEPGLDITFQRASIYATPFRAKLSASIDAITQMQNELGLSWNGAFLAVVQQRKLLEQNATLLREQVKSCLSDAKHVHLYDTQKAGVQFDNLESLIRTVRITIGRAKTKLAGILNFPVGAVDIFVDDIGAAYFSGLSSDLYSPTGVSYGDHTSTYRIGTLISENVNVYYVPKSLGVFGNTAENATNMLMLPRPTDPAISPFVGHIAVPMMMLNATPDPFEQVIGVYSRTAERRNPYPRFSNQGMLIQMINIPVL